MSEDRYFQFPLCALAYGADETKRINSIMAYCAVETGKTAASKLEDYIFEERAEAYAEQRLDGYDSGIPSHVWALMGAQTIGFILGSIQYSVRQHEELLCFINLLCHYGRQPIVRIRKDIAFDALNKRMAYREFAILCAIYSVIGAKQYPVRITRETIGIRCLGYKSPAMYKAEARKRKDGAVKLSPRQVGTTVAKLHERQFFARARANERQTYYSHRLTQSELEARIIASKTYSESFRHKVRLADQELMRKVREAKAAIKANTAISVDKTRDLLGIPGAEDCAPSPNGVRPGLAEWLSERPQDVHFNINSLRTNLPNRNASIETSVATAGAAQHDCGLRHLESENVAPVDTFTPQGKSAFEELKQLAANL